MANFMAQTGVCLGLPLESSATLEPKAPVSKFDIFRINVGEIVVKCSLDDREVASSNPGKV